MQMNQSKQNKPKSQIILCIGNYCGVEQMKTTKKNL